MTLNELVIGHQTLVKRLAKKLSHGGRYYDDLVSEGYLALIRAAEKFDPERGVKFSTYAGYWLRARMLLHLNKYAHGMVRTPPSYLVDIKHRLPRLRTKMIAAGLEVTDEIMALKLGCDLSDVRDLAEHTFEADVSIDMPTFDGDGPSLVEAMRSYGRNPEDEYIEKEQNASRAAEFSRRLAKLDDRKQEVIRRRFGEEPETLAAIASDIGMSRERVRQIEAEALRQLKGLEYLPPKQVEIEFQSNRLHEEPIERT